MIILESSSLIPSPEKHKQKTLPSYIPFPKKIETGFQVVTSRFPTFSCLFVVYIIPSVLFPDLHLKI